MGFGLGRPAGPSYPSAGARGCSENRQRQLALIDSPGLGQVAGKGERCMKGFVFIARSGGRNPTRAFNWEVTGKTPVGEQT